MRSEKPRTLMASGILVFSLFFSQGCGKPGRSSHESSGDQGLSFGQQPETFQSPLTSPDIRGDRLFLLDNLSGKIMTIMADPFAVVSSVDTPFQKKQSLLARHKDQFFVVGSGEDYALLDQSGTLHRNPAPLHMNIVGASVSPDGKALVLMDKGSNFALTLLSDDGKPEESISLGPVERGSDIQTGCLLDSRRLILAGKGKKLLVSDLPESIKKKEWHIVSEISLEEELTEDIQKVYSIPNISSGILVKSTDRLLVAVITEEKVLTRSSIKLPENTSPLIISQNSLSYIVQSHSETSFNSILPDGSVESKIFRLNMPLSEVKRAWLNPEDRELILLTSSEKELMQLRKIRISGDGYTLFQKDLPLKNPENLALSREYYFIYHHSPLGYLQRFPYLRDALPATLEGFNL